jgi:hypothetical protein
MQRHQRQHFQLQHHAMAHLQYKRTTQEASLADGPAPLNVAPPVYDRQQMQQLFTQRPDLAISRVLQVRCCCCCAGASRHLMLAAAS